MLFQVKLVVFVSCTQFRVMATDLGGVDARNSVPANVPLDGVDFTSLLQAGNQPPTRQYLYTAGFGGSGNANWH